MVRSALTLTHRDAVNHLLRLVVTVLLAIGAVVAQADININILPNQTMQITGTGYPANTNINVKVENLNTGSSITIVKTTDNAGNIPVSPNSGGSISASPGHVIKVSTQAPHASDDTAVVPPAPSSPTRRTLARLALKLIEWIIDD